MDRWYKCNDLPDVSTLGWFYLKLNLIRNNNPAKKLMQCKQESGGKRWGNIWSLVSTYPLSARQKNEKHSENVRNLTWRCSRHTCFSLFQSMCEYIGLALDPCPVTWALLRSPIMSWGELWGGNVCWPLYDDEFRTAQHMKMAMKRFHKSGFESILSESMNNVSIHQDSPYTLTWSKLSHSKSTIKIIILGDIKLFSINIFLIHPLFSRYSRYSRYVENTRYSILL